MTYEYESPGLPLDTLIGSTNIAKDLQEGGKQDFLTYVGNCALEGYNTDKKSRAEWEERSARAMELTLQISKEKTFPWEHASNVKVPLITIAALQFQAIAAPAILEAPDLVKCMVYGTDPDGSKGQRADRVSSHMSWQNLEQDEGWRDNHDAALLVQAIGGDAFIKRVYDPVCRHQQTKLVLPANFVINYYTRDLHTSPRYTETYDLSRNAIRTRELDGRFVKPYEDNPVPHTEPAQAVVDQLKITADERQGMQRPQESQQSPYLTGEQYCWWDLDGDGFEEPYIVTFDIGTGCVRRIVARFLPSGVKLTTGKTLAEHEALPNDAEVLDITPVPVFIKIPFVPSPDGGFYDIGLGQLLGDINESANTALNQLFDAATMSTLGGGFVGRGFKNRGGPFSMRPYEWYPIDAPGDDLRKNILPLPVREPSMVLFEVFKFLLDYAQKITQVTEIGMGESPGQNTPAQTTQTLDANGRRMVNAIFQRTWEAYKREYRLQYDLNSLYLQQSEDYADLSSGKGAMITQADYIQPSLLVRPSADPYITSEVMKAQQAMREVQMAFQLPGFNKYQTIKAALKAMRMQNMDAKFPPLGVDPQTGQPMQDFPPQPNLEMMKIELEKAKLGIEQQKLQIATFEAQVAQQEAQANVQIAMMELKEKALDLDKSIAETERLRAQAALYIAQAGSEQAEPYIKLLYAQIEDVAQKRNHMMSVLDTVMKTQTERLKIKADAAAGGTTSGDGTTATKKAVNVNLPAVVEPSDAIAQSNGMLMQ